MDVEKTKETLEMLRTGQLETVTVFKSDFLVFRETLLQQKDFKQFKGIAQRGGNVIYKYLDEPRS